VVVGVVRKGERGKGALKAQEIRVGRMVVGVSQGETDEMNKDVQRLCVGGSRKNTS